MDNVIAKKTKKPGDTHAVISVKRDVVEALNELRGSFSYSYIIKYMLLKCKYMKASKDDKKQFEAMSRYFGEDK